MKYPMDYLNWSTLKKNLGVKENDFSKTESHFNVRTSIYFKLAQLKRHLLLFKAAILKGINNPLAIFSANSRAASYPSRLSIRFILFGSPQKNPSFV